jgi:hypothetical protein
LAAAYEFSSSITSLNQQFWLLFLLNCVTILRHNKRVIASKDDIVRIGASIAFEGKRRKEEKTSKDLLNRKAN